LLALPLILIAATSHAGQDPNHTCTVFVHGFSSDGHSQTGVFGADQWDSDMDPFSELMGLPNIDDPGGTYCPNVVAATTYYGDTPPDYYTPEDIAELEAVTAEYGGGVPRYALIVAKYARMVMDRCGADQVNFFSGSYGTFVTRWLIEQDVENLAGHDEIARWLSAEGVLSGHWAASNSTMQFLWELFGTPSLDVDQMHYDWVEANLHSPRGEADDPNYGNILVGMMGSVDESANDGSMTDVMLTLGDYQPNDGIVGLYDSYFHIVTEQSRFDGRAPTLSYFHVNHYGLADYPAAWAQVCNFLTGRTRVTVTMTRAQAIDIHEPDDWWWDWTPAEIIFESKVYSPLSETLWGVTDPASVRHFDGVNTPIFEFDENGETITMEHLVFDDFVPEDETELNIQLYAMEIDWEERYDMYEVIGIGDPTDGMGGGWITIPITGPGVYTFAVSDWNCDLSVSIHDYPFELLSPTSEVGQSPERITLAAWPSPFSTRVSFTWPNTGGSAHGSGGVLSIFDVQGHLVRRLSSPRGGALSWDGRDAAGLPVAPGLYLQELQAGGRCYRGRCLHVR